MNSNHATTDAIIANIVNMAIDEDICPRLILTYCTFPAPGTAL